MQNKVKNLVVFIRNKPVVFPLTQQEAPHALSFPRKLSNPHWNPAEAPSATKRVRATRRRVRCKAFISNDVLQDMLQTYMPFGYQDILSPQFRELSWSASCCPSLEN
jgi:hypothetical protein